MTKSNPAKKLAEEIIESLYPDTGMDWRHNRIPRIEEHLRPTFDLLKTIHRLSQDAQMCMNDSLRRPHVMSEIESLTREYDND